MSDKKNPREILEEYYKKSDELVAKSGTIVSDLKQNEIDCLNIIIENSESSKGVLTVTVTSILYKYLYPEQDIRLHQKSIKNGYSGRTFDSKNVTPFLKDKEFPAMKESGWLTRSLEQKSPYLLNYKGSIQPPILKKAFLSILDYIQKGANPENYLLFLIQGLILQRNKQKIELAKPANLSINEILNILEKHFNYPYKAEGVSRLPTLAIYAIYQSLIKEIERFKGKKLLKIESHTSADKQSGMIGDIDVVDENDEFFEGVEIKYGIKINLQILKDAFKKISAYPVKRYYLLSTADIEENEMKEIQRLISQIKNSHGCQIIVNGILESLKYYLRLLNDTYEFINNYVKLVEFDESLKYEHREIWNKINTIIG